VLFFPLHFFKVFILGPFVLCGGLFGFLKLLPMYSCFLFNPKNLNSFSLPVEMFNLNSWCETMEKMLKGKRGAKTNGKPF